jgi:hypothetical protein
MRQPIIVVAALITSGCVSRQQPQAAAPTVATHRDSLRNLSERLMKDSLFIKSLRTDDLDSLAKELKAIRRKRG